MVEDAQTRELFELAKKIAKDGELVLRGKYGCDIFVGKSKGKQYRIEYEPSPGYDSVNIYGLDGFLSSLTRNMWTKEHEKDEYTYNGEISPEELRGLLGHLEKDEGSLRKIREDYLRSYSTRARGKNKNFLGEIETRRTLSDSDSSDSDLTKRAFGASALGYLFLGPIGLIFGPALIKKERENR